MGALGASAAEMLRAVPCYYCCCPPRLLSAGGGPSQECLVTLVMRLDLGGWLGQGSLLWRFGQPLSEAMLRSWLEPMLLSVVMLRDKVGGQAGQAAVSRAARAVAAAELCARQFGHAGVGATAAETAAWVVAELVGRCAVWMQQCFQEARCPQRSPLSIHVPACHQFASAGGAEPVCGAPVLDGGGGTRGGGDAAAHAAHHGQVR